MFLGAEMTSSVSKLSLLSQYQNYHQYYAAESFVFFFIDMSKSVTMQFSIASSFWLFPPSES